MKPNRKSQKAPKHPPITEEEAKVLKQRGIIEFIKVLRENRDLGLKDAYDLAKDYERGKK